MVVSQQPTYLRDAISAFFRQESALQGAHAGPSAEAANGVTGSLSSEPAEKVATNIPQEVSSPSQLFISLPNVTENSNQASPVGGRVRQFFREWEKITSDHVILEAVKGYKIEFDPKLICPTRTNVSRQYKRSASEIMNIQEELKKPEDQECDRTQLSVYHGWVCIKHFYKAQEKWGRQTHFRYFGLK